MTLIARFHAWRARRRHAAHQRWLRRNRIVITRRPDPQCIVRNRIR